MPGTNSWLNIHEGGVSYIALFGPKYAAAEYCDSSPVKIGLILSKGLTAVINDDLSGYALKCGAFLSWVVSFFAGFFIIPAFYKPSVYGDEDVNVVKICVGIIGGFLGKSYDFFLLYHF